MLNSSSAALSSLIKNSPLQDRTLVKLLRFRKLASGTLNLEGCQDFGDEIVDCIEGKKLPSNVNDEGNDDSAEATADLPYIEFLFLGSLRNDRGIASSTAFIVRKLIARKGGTTNKVEITKITLLALCIKLGVSVAFLDGVLKPSIWSKQSGGSFHVYDCNGEAEAINGFYHYFNEWDLGSLHTWFSYNVKSKSTTYLLFDCPKKIKERLTAGDLLPEPLAVDLMLAEECALWRENLINEHYQKIFNWHENTGAMDPPLNRHINTIDSMQELHQLSRTWNMIYEDLGDLEERLDFLLSTSEKFSSAGIQTRAMVEYITFVRGRNRLRRRWVTSFGERTKLIINFVFSIEGEENSKANTRLAATTTFIAKETARDNNSMKTIATMTMLFLPGAFVASVLQIPTKLWQFWAFTIPATIFVLVIYQVWRKTREGRMQLSDPERGTDTTLEHRRAV